MAFLAILAGLAVAGIVIACFIAYWMVMIILIALGVVFALWAVVFAWAFGDLYLGEFCALFATGITIWFWMQFDEKKKRSNAS